MADAYKGLTIEFRGDATDLSKALSKLRSESSSVERELRSIDKALEMDPGNVELLGQKARYTSQQANVLQERLELVNRALSDGSVERGTEAYDRLQRDLVTTSRRLDDTRGSARDAFNAFKSAADGADELSAAADDLAESVGGASDELGGILDGIGAGVLGGIGMQAVESVKDMALEAVGALAEVGRDYDAAFARIDASCGDAVASAALLKEAGRDLYTDGWGESLDDIAGRLVSVREAMGDLSESDMTYVTEGAMALEQAFGSDFSETVRGANALMDKFGLSARESMDLIAAGTQRGLDYTDELGDNLAEYAGRWGDAGMSASRYFSLLEAGADNGAYSLDKVGDYLNEFMTSLTDGRMEEAIGSFSEGTQATFESFKEGGATAEDVLDAVVGELASMPDEYGKAQLASELWSSLGEDNAMSMIESLANVEDSYGDVAGAAEDAANKVSDTAENRVQTALRRVGDALEPLADLGADALGAVAEGMTGWLEPLEEARERAELVERATRRIPAAAEDAGEGMSGLGDAASDAFEGVEDAAELGLDGLRRIADLKDEVEGTFSGVAGQAGALDAYVGTIEELAGQSSLTSYEQDKLRNAVDGYNRITGDSVEVTDDATGALSKSTDEIRENAEAWRHNAEVQANMDMYTRSLEEQAKASYDLEKAQDRVRQIREAMDEAALSGDYQGVVDMADDLREAEQAVDDLTVAYDESAEMVEHFDEAARLSAANLGATMTSAYEELPDALREKGAEVAGALQEGIDSGAVSAAEAASFLSGTVASEVGGLPPSCRQAGMDAALELARAVSSGSISVGQASQILAAACTGDLSGLPEDLAGYGAGAVAALASSLQSAPVTEAANQLRWSCQAELGMLPEGARSAGEAAVQQLAQAVANGQITSAQAAQVLRAACSGGLSGLPSDLAGYGTGAAAGLAAALGDTSPASSAAGSLASAAEQGVSGLPSALQMSGMSAGVGFAGGVSAGRGPTAASAKTLAEAASSMRNVGDTWSWGNEAGNNFASGLSGSWGAVFSAATSLASAVASQLHFSEPDEGPLVGINDSGQEMAENYAASMLRGAPAIRRAAGELASAASFAELESASAARLRAAASPRRAEGAGARGAAPAAAGTVINQRFETRVVRADEDLYAAAPIIYRNAAREARMMSR